MIVSIKGVTCGYNGNKVISDLNFVFRSGEAVCILGSNGIGKTTFFKTLIGQLDLLEGDILVDERPLKQIGPKERASIFSYVPQSKNCNYQFTVQDIIMMGRAAYIKPFASPAVEDYHIVDDVMEMLQISAYRQKRFHQLSGGQQQIVLLARAIAQGAKYILLDEPASNLDYLNQKKLLRIIHTLTESGVGVLMISHIPDHAFACCKNVLLIDREGRCMFGRVEEIITEENLSRIYGTSICTLKFTENSGETRYTCYLS